MAESYALLQHSLEALDVDAVGHALDQVPWLTRADARMLVRRAHGVLLDDLTRDEAEALTSALRGHGIPVEVVEQDWLRLPRVTPCRRADMDAQALSVYDIYGRVTRVPWSRVLLLAACSYMHTERRVRPRSTLEHAMSSYGAGRFHGRMAFQDTIEPREVEHSEQERAILDVLVDLPARYRIEPDRFDYGYLAERRAAGTTANFQLLVKDLIERAPHVVQTRGLRGLSSQARKATRYMGVQQYEREMAWSLWRHAGPGTRLDLAGPYRAHGAAGPRLRAPLARAAAEPAPDSTGQAQPAPPDPRAGALAPVRDDAGELRAAQRIADAGITVGYSLVVGFVIAFWTGSGVPILLAPPLALGVHHLRRRWRRARRRRDLVHSSEDRGPIANDDAFAPGAGRDHT